MVSLRYNTELGLSADKPFNMAILFLERLNKRLDERDTHRINGNILGWFRCLRSIYANIYFKVKEKGNETEEKELKDLFTKAKNFLKGAAAESRENTQQLQNIALTNIELILDEIDIKINTLMYEYGLVFPPEKEKRDPNKAIKEVFRH